MPLRPIRAREIVRKLEHAGFVLRRQRAAMPGLCIRRTGRHGADAPRDIPVPVIRSILAQTGLSGDEWERL